MFQHILVPVADDASSQIASRHAQNLSRLLGCRLTFVHVLSDEPLDPVMARTSAQSLLERMANGSRFPPSLRVVTQGERSVPERILEVAHEENTDLIVMGTRGGSGIERLALGSVALGVVDASEVPVQLIPVREPSGRRFVDRWFRALTRP